VKASFVNDSGLPFLAGENQVYRNGSYMGRSRLDYAAVGETLNLSSAWTTTLACAASPSSASTGPRGA
jgi:hypothetical protein